MRNSTQTQNLFAMKQITLLFASLLIAACTFAGVSIDWMRMPDLAANKGTAIARDASDNVYTTTSTGSIILEKRNRFGDLQWQVTSSTSLPFNYEFPVSIHIDPQGNAVVVGYRHTVSSEGHFANALIVLQYNTDGGLIYKKNFEGTYSYFNNSQYWTKVSSQMDAGGNLYIGTAGSVTGYPSAGFNAIKVSPSGNIVWVSTKQFSSPTLFHFVTSMRLKGSSLGLTGVTSYSSANATTWVLDTTGTDHWNAITDGIQGKDLAFDVVGNTYMLTWISPNFSGDIALYKFDANGIQMWFKTYDFGGSDLATKIEATPDGNFAIMAYGNKYPNGSLYVDWLTLKVNKNGTLLWSKRYDTHTGNDEIPYAISVDASNNVYVTGIGGPYPGGPILSARQMVTVKYAKNGVPQWSTTLDTLSEYNAGVGIAIATDGSLFVVGSVNTFIVHYLNHSGTDVCTAPTDLSTTAITENSATLHWSAVGNAYLYHIQFKPSTSTIWQQLSTDATSYTLSSLFLGTSYDFRIEAVCTSSPTGYSAIQQFTTLGTGYCETGGLDASLEWIDLVYINTLLNSTIGSEGVGYVDYTNLSTDLIQGGTFDITLSAEMSGGNYYEVWRVWIDYNQDGDFEDSGEKEVGYKSNQIGWETHTFSVPSTATVGQTRMRVSMKNSTAPTPCETFARGQVEDYSINILPAKSLENNSIIPASSAIRVLVFPNPVTETASVAIVGQTEKLSVQLLDLTGRVLLAQEWTSIENHILSMNSYDAGIYLLRVTDELGNVATTRVVKQ